MLEERPLLAIENLRKVYAHRGTKMIAVDAFSGTLFPGGSIGIVGESGAGKSTVAKCVVGLETPSAGTIRLSGTDVSNRTSRSWLRRRSKDVQLVAQHPRGAFDPLQRVDSAIEEVLRLHTDLDRSARRDRTFELLQSVALSERNYHSLPRELSGGQLQRVAIARALAVEPKLLVLDEFVSALDVSVQARILNLIDDIRERTRIATLVITHDLAVVRHMADEVFVMKAGFVVESGPTNRVLDDPQHEYTQALKAAVPTPGWELGPRMSISQDPATLIPGS